jgi:lipase (class 3)
LRDTLAGLIYLWSNEALLRRPSAMPRLANDTLSRSSLVAARRIDPRRGLKQETFFMSVLVELPQELFPADALDRLEIRSDYKLENAQAMMWMSQLAYETAHVGKVDDILKAWKLTKLEFGSRNSSTGPQPRSARFVIAEGRDAEGHSATIVTFSGTDPVEIEDWITNFTVAPEPDVLHQGFADAVEAVWPKIKTTIESRPAGQPLFFTGHSLGGALALIAAERALRESRIQAMAVYTFGGPRVGGQTFFDRYAPLGERTFRLVNGGDIVPTVPPSLGGNFRHVGRAIQCRINGIFQTPPSMMASDENEPDFVESVLQSALADLGRFPAFRLPHIGPGLLGLSIGALPEILRDHVPRSYFRALSIRLE